MPRKPAWTRCEEQKTIRACKGSFVEITCRVSAYPPPKIIWCSEGEKLDNRDRLSPLTLKQTISVTTFGDYVCVARKELGQDRFAIQLVDSERILKYVCCVRKSRQVMRKRKRRMHKETMKAMDLRPNNKRGMDGKGGGGSKE